MLATEVFAKQECNPTLLMWFGKLHFLQPNLQALHVLIPNRGAFERRLEEFGKLPTAVPSPFNIEPLYFPTVWLSFATTTIPESQRTVGSGLHLLQPLLPGALGEFPKCDGWYTVE